MTGPFTRGGSIRCTGDCDRIQPAAMARLSYPLRFVALVALSSLSLLILCASMAIFLYRMQTITAEALSENIVSRQAASDLNDRLAQLADRLRQGKVPFDDLHEKINNDLKEI